MGWPSYFILILPFLTVTCSSMSLYEYYVPDGVRSEGLIAEGSTFTLNGQDIRIYSGAMHYFRIHPAYWRDTLRKLRSCGLNTVETYSPWNLHNPEKDQFDFGTGGRDMSDFLDLRTFVQLAQEEDLFVILRPGPYICSEWDYGGMPYWLLKDPANNPRTSYVNFTSAVASYFNVWSDEVRDHTFMRGGPIIAMQIENEYGHFGYDDEPRDKNYLSFIKNLLDANDFGDVLYFTSDAVDATLDWGALPGVLQTTNFGTTAEAENVDSNLDTLKLLQPNRPLMVMEFWAGFYDHWLSGIHVTTPVSRFQDHYGRILQRNASVNIYMFIGGTNFGFMAGANHGLTNTVTEYTPIVTSYDYDAPLREHGDYGEKFQVAKDLLAQYNPLSGVVNNPDPPAERTKTAYGDFPVEEVLSLEELTSQSKEFLLHQKLPISMEELGLDYGYVVYTYSAAELEAGSHTLLIRGHVRDMAQVLINGVLQTKPYRLPTSLNHFGFWNKGDLSLSFSMVKNGPATISIIVENLGRVDFGQPHFFKQKKGLWEGFVSLDDVILPNWNVTLMGFKKPYINSLTGWNRFDGSLFTPASYRVNVPINSPPTDTFLDMRRWNKGAVFVNGFNLGRYWKEGPLKSLYIPAPLLKQGNNEFVIYEQYDAPDPAVLKLMDYAILGPLS